MQPWLPVPQHTLPRPPHWLYKTHLLPSTPATWVGVPVHVLNVVYCTWPCVCVCVQYYLMKCKFSDFHTRQQWLSSWNEGLYFECPSTSQLRHPQRGVHNRNCANSATLSELVVKGFFSKSCKQNVSTVMHWCACMYCVVSLARLSLSSLWRAYGQRCMVALPKVSLSAYYLRTSLLVGLTIQWEIQEWASFGLKWLR